MRLIAAAGLVLGAVALSARADDKPLDRAALDKRAAKVAYDTALLGSKLWAAQNYEGCFRLYQGSLMALGPMLDHRPDLAARVADVLDKGGRLRPEEGAFVFRAGLDAVMKDAGGAAPAAGKEAKGPEVKAPPPQPKGPPLWDRIGGEKVARAVVKDFLDAALKDPKANLSRGGQYKWEGKDRERLEQVLVEFLNISSGGSMKYTGPDWKATLTDAKFTDAEYRALLGHLGVALSAHKVPVAEMEELLEGVKEMRAATAGK